MIKSRKGFMLVEVVITSAVVITTLVFLYSSFSNLFVKYNSRTNYHNVDALYATKEMVDYLFQNDFNRFINTNLYTSESIYLIQEGECKLSEQSSFCNVLSELYGVNNMIFTSYDKTNLMNLRDGDGDAGVTGVGNETMKEYIDYVIGYYGITDSNIIMASGEEENPYSYFIITELEEEENCYYAGVPIR